MSTKPATIPTLGKSVENLMALAGKGKLTADEIARKGKAYLDKLVEQGADPRDVAAGVDIWLAMKPDAFPDSWYLFSEAVEEARFKRVAAEAAESLDTGHAPPPRPGENFVRLALRLDVHAGRLAAIGFHRYEPLADAHAAGRLDYAQVREALDWLEHNPGKSMARGFLRGLDGSSPNTVKSARGVWADLGRTRENPASVGGVEMARHLDAMGMLLLERAAEEGRLPPEAIGKLPRPSWAGEAKPRSRR